MAVNTETDRIPYSRYGYRPPGSAAATADGDSDGPPGSGGGYRSPRAATQRSYLPCAPTPAPAEPEQEPLDAPPAYETLAPLGPPSYETVCRELATKAAGPDDDGKK